MYSNDWELECLDGSTGNETSSPPPPGSVSRCHMNNQPVSAGCGCSGEPSNVFGVWPAGLPHLLHPYCGASKMQLPLQMGRQDRHKQHGQKLATAPWVGCTAPMATVKPNSEGHGEHAVIESVTATAPLLKGGS